jgi:hypothetical protein
MVFRWHRKIGRPVLTKWLPNCNLRKHFVSLKSHIHGAKSLPSAHKQADVWKSRLVPRRLQTKDKGLPAPSYGPCPTNMPPWPFPSGHGGFSFAALRP